MRGIELLHPELQPIANKFVQNCKAVGLNVKITETFRTKSEQDTLYAKGRTAPGKIVTKCKYPESPHCWGVAFDFCRDVKGQEYDDKDGFFFKCGAIGKTLGLFWGGDFKSYYDGPHLEFKKFMPSNSVKMLITKYGTPEKFKNTWSNQIVDVSTELPILRKGDNGEDVKALQHALGTKGFAMVIDGSFGNITDRMVRLFQKSKGLTVDGVVGPKTWGALGL